jgi:hypothetical protein
MIDEVTSFFMFLIGLSLNKISRFRPSYALVFLKIGEKCKFS